MNNGVIPLTELSAALNTALANSGVNELCINIGTIIGENIAHLVAAIGTKNVDIKIIKNVTKTKTIPVNSKLLIQFANIDTINVPKLVCLNIKQNWAAKKIRTSNDDKSFK